MIFSLFYFFISENNIIFAYIKFKVMKDRGLLFMEKFRQLPWDDYGLDWCGDLSEVYGNFIEHEDKEVFIAYSVEADEVVYSFSIESDHIKYGSSKDFGDLTEVFDKILEFFEIEKKL